MTAVVLLTVPALVRAGRRARRSAGSDAPTKLLALAVTGLPESHREWGRAMCAELAAVPAGRPRWRFSIGCTGAAAVIRARVALTSREPGGAGLRAVVGVGLFATMVLATYGLAHYPALGADGDAAIVAIALPTLLVLYGTITLALSRGTRVREVTARRHGLTGGVVIGTAWLLVLSPTSVLKQWVLVPLIIALFAPGVTAIVAARAGGVVTAGTRSALWSGIVGGLLVFIVSMTTTYVSDGRPYDPQLLRDLPHSGAPDLATLAVSDALGNALTLLILIPLTALALGSLGARLARTADPTAASAPPSPAPPT